MGKQRPMEKKSTCGKENPLKKIWKKKTYQKKKKWKKNPIKKKKTIEKKKH